MVAAGASNYKVMCQHCHAGVGASRAGWAKGMVPHPPALAHAAQEGSAEEVFWLVKHGIKASGMPAFGPTHDEEATWNIATFVKAMPQMSAERYAALGERQPGGEQHGGHSH
ncbi:cytochrome c [Porphyrobacter sp. GA68]|uniref:c-type cytochrome n=1 Tax=Porphyrobacter sp. GA68 TaxID=2883480 RepID=UPI001D17D44F|nr:cytochrome c [Porphyrobacter sp. GA68]